MSCQDYELHPISLKVLAHYEGLFDLIEPHPETAAENTDASDILWFSTPTDGGTVPEIIGVTPLLRGGWTAWHMRCNPDKWPTLWAVAGTEDHVFAKLVAYLSEKAGQVARLPHIFTTVGASQ